MMGAMENEYLKQLDLIRKKLDLIEESHKRIAEKNDVYAIEY